MRGTELREPDFAKFLFATLERFGLPAQKLSLEIVESVIVAASALKIPPPPPAPASSSVPARACPPVGKWPIS